MSLDETDTLSFNGTGPSDTVLKFIKRVRKRAIKAQQQRNDKWIADCVSVLFEGDALDWYEGLDSDVQNDWKLLRPALVARWSSRMEDPEAMALSAAPDCFKFEGHGVTNCQQFTRYVRARAEYAGKAESDTWKARLAFQCFAGPALVWYSHLRPEVRKSWARLELALICQYPYTTLSALSPARIRVDDWDLRLPPSETLRELGEYGRWLAAARKRRAKWAVAGDMGVLCWVLVEGGQPIPSNSIVAGYNRNGESRFSARTWCPDGSLLIGWCGRDLSGARFSHKGKDMQEVRAFEVLVGNPSLVHWVIVPTKIPSAGYDCYIKHKPFLAVEGGFIGSYDTKTATFIARVPINEHVQPGTVASARYTSSAEDDGREQDIDHVQVLAWAE